MLHCTQVEYYTVNKWNVTLYIRVNVTLHVHKVYITYYSGHTQHLLLKCKQDLMLHYIYTRVIIVL